MDHNIKILMIDDHPLILEGYKSKLRNSFHENELKIIIDTAHDCDEGYERLQKSLGTKQYDVVFLDINLPPSKDMKFLSGEDLGQEFRKFSPDTALIVLTMFSENLRLINILKNLNPDAFMIKSDVTPDELLKAFNKVRNGEVHYSQSISQVMRKQLTTSVVIDENDRSILYYLAEGMRTKDLVEKVPLSLAAIEKRKKMMKEIFEVEKGGDLALITAARREGFL